MSNQAKIQQILSGNKKPTAPAPEDTLQPNALPLGPMLSDPALGGALASLTGGPFSGFQKSAHGQKEDLEAFIEAPHQDLAQPQPSAAVVKSARQSLDEFIKNPRIGFGGAA